ncbi:MAG: hypothetical protein EBU90_15585, partial [Proteobacteria bacterium]|nr:hypothetical protein [Pseudomonadota bacterium]NBP16142.1 hypothetical protein [bacterium]
METDNLSDLQDIDLDGVENETPPEFQAKENEKKESSKTKPFVWKELDEHWKLKLLSSAFVVKDCIGDGNCQFRSIETALTDSGYRMTHEKLRKMIAQYINKMSDAQFYEIVQNYRLEKQNGDFEGNWDPDQIRNKKDFITNIVKSGFHFQGDNITLSLLSKAINLDFVILDDNYNITDLSNPDELHDRVVVLYYQRGSKTGGHYMTIGIRTPRGKVYTLFSRGSLPQALDHVLDKHTLMLSHVAEIVKQTGENVTLNVVIRELERRLQTKLTASDRKQAFIILRNLLENHQFFQRAANAKSRSKTKPKAKSKSKSKSKSKRPRSKTS